MLASIVVMRGVLNAISKLDPSAGADVLLSQAGELLEKNHLEYGELSNFISSAALPMPQRLVPIFRTLVKGLIEKRAVRISYTGNKDRQPRTRVIHPYHLLEFEGRWHCISHCTEAKESRTFMLWRTHTAELLDEPFVRPAEFDDPKQWEEKANIYGVWSGDGKPITVKVKMFGYAARLIQEAERRHPGMTITESNADDGAVEVAFQTHAFADVTSWILKWGPYCKVLGPPALVKEVRELIERMGKLYDAH
jgi:predicted DNA-binding transcriptional regulator YafY